MKRMKIGLLAAGLLLVASASWAQQAEAPIQYMSTAPLSVRFWHLGLYPFSNGDVPKEIAKVVENGLFPTGIEVSGGNQLVMTYARLLGMPGTEAFIKIITDLTTLNATIQREVIDQGYIPMDLAVTEKGVMVLCLQSPVKITNWVVFRVKGDGLKALEAEAKKYASAGYAMLGMSSYKGNQWGLMVRTDKPLFPGAEIKGYPNDGSSIIQGLEYQTSFGSLPLGIMIDGGLVYCNFSAKTK